MGVCMLRGELLSDSRDSTLAMSLCPAAPAASTFEGSTALSAADGAEAGDGPGPAR